MKTQGTLIGLVTLVTSVIVAITAAAAPKEKPFRAIWRAIADLQVQIAEISLIPGPPGPQGPAGPPGVIEEADLAVENLAVGDDRFTYNSTIDPKLIVHDESNEATTIAFFKYSDGYANHVAQARARGTISSPESVQGNDVVAQYNGKGYLDQEFKKVAALNMQVDADGDLASGMSGKLVFKVAGYNGSAHSFSTAAEMDRRLRTLFHGAVALKHRTHAITSDQNDFELGEQRTSVHRLTTDAARTITGFVATRDINSSIAGEVITLINVGSDDLILANQNTNSTPENRIITGSGGNLTLIPDESATMFYDQISERWRVISTTGA
jgi:hypothetical protein